MADRPELSERGKGTVETLTTLLYETHSTETHEAILSAAFDSDMIPEEMVHRAREWCDRRVLQDSEQ